MIMKTKEKEHLCLCKTVQLHDLQTRQAIKLLCASKLN